VSLQRDGATPPPVGTAGTPSVDAAMEQTLNAIWGRLRGGGGPLSGSPQLAPSSSSVSSFEPRGRSGFTSETGGETVLVNGKAPLFVEDLRVASAEDVIYSFDKVSSKCPVHGQSSQTLNPGPATPKAMSFSEASQTSDGADAQTNSAAPDSEEMLDSKCRATVQTSTTETVVKAAC